MTLEQQRAIALARARQAQASAQPQGRPTGFMGLPLIDPSIDAGAGALSGMPSDPNSPLMQGLSGVNEGIANTLSLPNTVELGLRSIGPAVVNSMGGNVQLPTESILPDMGARYRDLADTFGAIKPETDDGMGRFARRVGQEAGAMLIPGLGTVSKATSPARVAVTEAASALGAGAGAAGMQQAFPDNPYAEIAGEAIGGMTPLAISNAIERGGMKVAAPTLDELRSQKSAAYKAADDLGVQYAPQAMNRLVQDMKTAGAKINPMRHPKAASMLAEIEGLAGTSPTLGQLDELRQTIARDLIKSSDGAERYWGYQFNNALDDFIAKAGGKDVLAGDPVAANSLINQARALNTRYRKVEDFDRSMDKARNAAASSGSGGNVNNAVRQKARAILDNPKRTMGYSPDELAALKLLITQGRGENLLRGVGKMAPGGNGLMTALNVGAIAHNPAMAAVPVVAQGAKFLADRGTIKRADKLRSLLATGAQQDIPLVAPDTQKALAALIMGSAANQNEPQSPVLQELLRLQGLN